MIDKKNKLFDTVQDALETIPYRDTLVFSYDTSVHVWVKVSNDEWRDERGSYGYALI